jgi:hypothetical protein
VRASLMSVALASMMLSGCMIRIGETGVQGSGVLKEETRDVPDFTGVDIGSAIQATITVGPKTSVKISGDDNLLPLIKTEVRDGRLVTRVEGPGIRTVKPLTMTITTPKLDYVGASGASTLDVDAAPIDKLAVQVSGASKATVKGIESDSLDVGASGATTVTLSGKAKRAKVDVSGASTIRAFRLPVESAQADVSGASRVEVRASDSVSGEASGASSIKVAGKPKSRSVSTSGASSISYSDGE